MKFLEHAATRLLQFGLLVVLSWPGHASAESLRCSGGIVSEGDSRLSLVYKCGEPKLKDSYCSPVYYPGTLDVVPEAYALRVVPCVVVDAWLYERGPGELVATVYLRSGVVQSIGYGGTPR
jgi:hypothetical protein